MDYKTKTKESYNLNAREFSEKFKELMDLERRDEFKIFMDLLCGNKILDLGCGSGDHSLYFKEKGFDVVAIDLSESMVELSKEKGINAIIMDIEDLKFEKESFDGIWAVTSLLHVPKANMAKVINKIYEILKNNGIFYVCVKEGKGEGFVKDKNGTGERFFAFWDEDELKNLFKNNFELIESKKVKLKSTIFIQAFFRKMV